MELNIDSRKTTTAEDLDSDSDEDDQASAVDCLVLTFDRLLALDNLQNGLQLGTNPTSSHVLLGRCVVLVRGRTREEPGRL